MTFALAADFSSVSASPSGLAVLSDRESFFPSRLLDGVANLWGRMPQATGSYGVSGDTYRTSFKSSDEIEDRLSSAKELAKVEIAKIATRISPEWRTNLFWQLDALLDADDWDNGDDQVLSIKSWQCFLKGLFVLRSERLPGLGLADGGNIVASWGKDAQHLDIEFKAGDQVRWVLAAQIEGEMERAAGRTSIFRLRDVLIPYSPERWFAN